MRTSFNPVFLRIGDELGFAVGEHRAEFLDESARCGVGAKGGKEGVAERKWNGRVTHLNELGNIVLKLVLVLEMHAGNVGIEKIFEITILFGQAGKLGDSEDQAIDVRIILKSDFLNVVDLADDARINQMTGGAAAVGLELFTVVPVILDFAGEAGFGPRVEKKSGARTPPVESRASIDSHRDMVGAAIGATAGSAQLEIGDGQNADHAAWILDFGA